MSKSLAFRGLVSLLLVTTAGTAWAAPASGRVSDYTSPVIIAAVSPMAKVKSVNPPIEPVAVTTVEPLATPVTPVIEPDPVHVASVAPTAPVAMQMSPIVEETPPAVVKEEKIASVTPPTTKAASMIAPSSSTNPLPTPDFNGEKPMNVSADEMIYEQKLDKVTAIGKVIIVQEGRKMEADKVDYYVTEDRAYARGNVVLTDTNGDVHKAEEIEMKDAFKDGFVKSLSSILHDGSRITAREGERINATKIILKDAWYTPCKPCQENPDETPDWNVVADQVTLDQEKHRVTYKNAKFEMFGIPVLYTPYLSHSDGTIKQKSGLLPPRVGYSSQIGTFADVKYYQAIAPDRDATIGAIITGREGAVATGEYRRRFDKGDMQFGGTITESTRPLDNDERSDKEIRGSVNGTGRYDINNKWRAGYKVDLASDDQYLRQYKLPYEDVLENKIYAERFDDRDYASIQALGFQDTRISRADIDQPYVLPWVEIEHYSDPKAILGGRTKVTGSTVGLIRDGSAQDMQRFSGQAEWNRRTIVSGGFVNDTDLTARGDLYAVQDRFTAATTPGQGTDDTISRTFLQANTKMGYPLAKRLKEGSLVIEPQAALAISNDVRNLDDIPNEDSQDVDFSISQLFAPSRFTGYDRVDDGTRATVGMSTQYVGDTGRQGEIFFGQSYRLSSDTNPFPDGSGLEKDRSDLVGRVRYVGKKGSAIEYGARFDEESLAANRHDLAVNLVGDPISVAATYFYLAPLEGTDLLEDQEQIAISPVVKLSDEWNLRSTVRYDLSGDQDEQGLQTASLSLEYFGDCINYSATVNRNNLDEASGSSETEVYFSIGFKNLAQIETSPISFGERDDLTSN